MPSSLKLKPSTDPRQPFSWDTLTTPSPPQHLTSPPSPPTSWLSARDMKLFGAQPLNSDFGVVKCKECDKPVLRSFVAEHTDNCNKILSGGKKLAKGKGSIETEDVLRKGSKKRKASPEPSDPTQPAKKKSKPMTKVTKGRFKGPVDYDKQCGVINDKNLPCSRSLTCKSHSMGAKRAVQGRSRNYDELLLDWQREHNPNWVEPVKKETKAEKKEKKEREKAEKKRLALEAAAAAGIDLSKKGAASAVLGGNKKGGKKAAAAAAAAAGRLADALGDDVAENLDDLDSEAEVDDLVKAVRVARERGIMSVPLAVPCDAGSWFVARRERKRCCKDLLVGALGSTGGTIGGLAGGAAMAMAMSMGPNGKTTNGTWVSHSDAFR